HLFEAFAGAARVVAAEPLRAFGRQFVDDVRALAPENRRSIEADLGGVQRFGADRDLIEVREPGSLDLGQSLAEQDVERLAAVPAPQDLRPEAVAYVAHERASDRVRRGRVFAQEAQAKDLLEPRQDPEIFHRARPLIDRQIVQLWGRRRHREALDAAWIRQPAAEHAGDRERTAAEAPGDHV